MTEERILDFLDGNLGSSEEEELLHRLAVSPERRNLLKQHLQMRELTSSLARRQFVHVPKAVTASLFTALAASGYAGPTMPASNSEALVASLESNLDKIASNVTSVRPNGLFRRSSVLLLSVASFLAGAALLYFIMPEARQNKFADNVSQIFNTAPAESVVANRVIEQPNTSITNEKFQDANHETYRTHKSDVAYKSYPVLIENLAVSNSPVISLPLIVEPITKISVISAPVNVSSDVRGESFTRNPFDQAFASDIFEKSFLQRLKFSFRFGEGKAPGNELAFTGSLTEVKASYDLNNWLSAKVSLGYFAPFETEAIAAKQRFNADGIPLLQLSSIQKNRVSAGIEIGARWQMFNAPFEIAGGFISDFQGNFIPRAGLFTDLLLSDNMDLNLGLEGMIYSHDIRSSLTNAQQGFSGRYPSLIGQMKEKESTGFIGPAVELVWHL
jgi:hypothetical protein